MKKLIVVFLALSMILGSVFAAEPTANVSVTEFTGEASVKWGVDLDSGLTGFDNTTKVVLKLNLFDAGEKSTTGEGVWAELKIKTDSDTFIGWENTTNDKKPANKGLFDGTVLGLTLVVDVAKIHFGDAYVGIKSGNTTVGEFKLQQAIYSTGDNSLALSDVGNAAYKYGIVAGYATDLFAVDVDFRSAEVASTKYTNQYAVAADVKVTPLDGLEVKAGVSYNFPIFTNSGFAQGLNIADTVLGLGANVAYKYALNDTFYVKPQVGFTMSNTDTKGIAFNSENKLTASASAMWLNAGVLFAWGAEKDDNAGVYFFDDAKTKKITPGISVQARIPITSGSKTYSNGDVFTTSTVSGNAIEMSVTAFSGEIVENLTAAFAVVLPVGFGYKTTTTVEYAGGSTYSGEGSQVDMALNLGLGAKYKLALDPIALTLKAGVYYADNTSDARFDGITVAGAAGDDVLNIKAGVDVGGLINNTTFSLDYASANLSNTATNSNKTPNVKLGQLSVSAKIAF